MNPFIHEAHLLAVAVTLQIKFVDKYPEEAPVVLVEAREGLPESDLETLRQKLQEQVCTNVTPFLLTSIPKNPYNEIHALCVNIPGIWYILRLLSPLAILCLGIKPMQKLTHSDCRMPGHANGVCLASYDKGVC